MVHNSFSEISLDAGTFGWIGGKPGIGACNYELNKFISVSPPAHLHDLYISDLELLAHLLVVRVWSPQLVHRLKMAPIYAPDQISHDYRAQSARFSTEVNWLADALTRPGSEKH